MYKLLLITFLSLFLVLPAFAQEDVDTTETEEWDDWDDWEDEEGDWGEDFHMNMFDVAGSPTIAVSYGLSKLQHHDLAGSFAEPRSVEVKLGYTDIDKVWQSSHILKTSFKHIYVSNITTDLSDIAEDSEDYETNTWRFGIGNTSGYGYDLGASAIYLTNGGSINWTRLKMNDPVEEGGIDREPTEFFHNSFRFGNSAEAGIRFQIISQLSLEANYERTVVFPRHLFWKWLGSVAIEGAAQVMVDIFVGEILDSSPYFAPVMGFLLKNGLSYGMYELRQEKMNWPFNSAPPLAIDQFKFGITFVL
jgi:hypothetical protein